MNIAQSVINKNETEFLEELAKSYTPFIQVKIDTWVKQSNNPQTSWKKVLDYLDEIIMSTQNDLERILDTQLLNGGIFDKDRVVKTITAMAYSDAIIYAFIHNKLVKNISERILITNDKSTVPNSNRLITISVGEYLKKLNPDLIIYSVKENSELDKCIILSFKTSSEDSLENLHEWKLLMEIAMSDCEVRDKYEISYNPPTIPLVCFVTVNFYNEINNPQHRGMFKFFDRAFIGKPIDPNSTNFIFPLSSLIDFANEQLTSKSL